VGFFGRFGVAADGGCFVSGWLLFVEADNAFDSCFEFPQERDFGGFGVAVFGHVGRWSGLRTIHGQWSPFMARPPHVLEVHFYPLGTRVAEADGLRGGHRG
jgi:hypothetical protein